MNKHSSPLIVLSTGGTGGHIMPAAALADDLLSRGFDVHVFLDSRGESYQSKFVGCTFHILKAGTLGSGLFGKIKGAAKLAIGFLQAQRLIARLSPSVVIGFGGYPSFAGVYAAQKAKISTIIHEQNAIIGKANAYLAPKADRIALSLPQITGVDEHDKTRCVVTGNPVRSDIASLYNKAYPVLQDNGDLNIFIMGGSLGASIFAQVIPKALSGLDSAYRKRLKIIQQCRSEDLEHVKNVYAKAQIAADVEPFFEDVAELLEQTHLFIGRSGASTVAEIATAGRPAIFVPYPHHKDQQQKMNAETLADAGGAWVMTENGFTEEALLARIETFLHNPQTLFKAAENARSCGKPDAARKLGNLVTALASGWN